MVYLESRPSPPLADCIRLLWYTRAPDVPHQRERVLPSGCAQIVISLATDTLSECGDAPEMCIPIAPSLLVGARGRYEIINTRDMAELVGIVFRPGGLGPWLRQRADAFFETSVALQDAWGIPCMRTRLREEPTPARKMAMLDALLVEGLRGREVARRPLVKGALCALGHNGVRETAQSLGVSERRLHQIFREDVGLSPKLWSRVHRFQKAVGALHAREQVRWERLALDCGYYDQSHFCRDFRDFSGIDPTTYSEQRGPWKNHLVHC